MVDCDVTLRTLTLGGADEITGWYAKTWSTSTIWMYMAPRGTPIYSQTGFGLYAKYGRSGFTDGVVAEADEILDGAGQYWEIKTVDDVRAGPSLVCYQCELVKVPMHWDRPATYGTTPVPEDSRWLMKDLIQTYDDLISATEDDNSTPADYIVSFADPPYPISKVFVTKGVDGIYSIDFPSSEGLPSSDGSPYGYLENVPVAIGTMDKTTISGDKLLLKMENGLRAIMEAHPNGSLRTVGPIRKNTVSLGSGTIYSREYTARYKRGLV